MHSREAGFPRGEGLGGGFPFSAPLRVSVSLPGAPNGSAVPPCIVGTAVSLRSTLYASIFNGE